jgi:hypothetical protein
MFALKRGLAVFQSVRAYGGYYYIDALDAGGQQIGTIGAGSGPNDESVAVPIAADGMYGLRVQAEGGWTVNVSQPTATYAAPPARQQWRGHGWQATPLFSLKTGPAHFHVVSPNDQAAQAQTPARVDLLDQEGTQVGSFAAGTDPIDVTTDLTIPADGVYLLRVYFYQADWTISVEQ